MPDRTVSRRDALKIVAVAGVSVALGGRLTMSVLKEAGLHRVSQTRTQMGTLVTLTVVHPEKDSAHAMITAAFSEMDRLESILSRHRDDTPVSELNRTGRLGRVPRELALVVADAKTMGGRSGGAFDITVAPLLTLVESSFLRDGRPPSDDAVERVLELVDHEAIRIENDVMSFDQPGMSVTLDGIAKGFIVDRTKDVLLQGGAERVMVNAGGDIATADGPGMDPWTVGVQDPDNEQGIVTVVRLDGVSLATSGDYMRTFTNDRTHHHIVDPRTGRSPQEVSSVSVVHPSAMWADAYATALLVMGTTKGMAMLQTSEGLEGLFMNKQGERIASSGFDARSA
jgi:thiamine biosynthesis lipoprotein